MAGGGTSRTSSGAERLRGPEGEQQCGGKFSTRTGRSAAAAEAEEAGAMVGPARGGCGVQQRGGKLST